MSSVHRLSEGISPRISTAIHERETRLREVANFLHALRWPLALLAGVCLAGCGGEGSRNTDRKSVV